MSQALTAAASLDATSIQDAYPLALEQGLPYDPAQAVGLELIQKSALALNGNQLTKLGQNGFVIATDKKYPSFLYGYKTIYSQDLPVYISADSILFAVHRSYDDLLRGVELSYMLPELDRLLDGMRQRLESAGFDRTLSKDVDLYLTVAKSLLQGKLAPPVAGATAEEVSAITTLATAASGHRMVTLFGTERDEDFSQFTPRGHYADHIELRRYFQAMMWLGRVDLRLIETQTDGSQLFSRHQFDAAVALREVMGAAERERWQTLDQLIGWFVGERDSMAFPDLDGLLAALGKGSFAEALALSDSSIVAEIEKGGWGAQRIASRIIINARKDATTLPLDRSFSVFGQRYTVDSHVFVNTTFDRVPSRMLPDPLDAAFGALGNDSALALLAPGFHNQKYVAGLATTRTLVDAHEPAYWEGSLYTSWLGALRALSPASSELGTLPAVARTRAFQNRILNTQLASWAELRHDTVLYAKQSYTAGSTCEFPDAYVDPYPELYARLARFADRVTQIAEILPAVAPALRENVVSWAANFKTAMGYLERMAEAQKTGATHSAETMNFVNEAVRWDEQNVCGSLFITNMTGWYGKLFLNAVKSAEFSPTIVDVHTQPTDEQGNFVGKVLHAGTGHARLMVTTIDTCSGPRAYVGLASSYGQILEEKFKRLTDQEWSQRIGTGAFPDVPWMQGLLAE